MPFDGGASSKRPGKDDMSRQIGVKEHRKIRARQQDRSVWFGLGMFGLVGWSIAVPTVIGIAVGLWMDRTWDHDFSCTLMGLFAGVVGGCTIAWYWVKRESLGETEAKTDAASRPPGEHCRKDTRK
jgi:ATP synthase protein I